MLEAGSLFGGYEIRSVLGMGGMGVVYEAVQPHLKRDVALKVLDPRLADSPSFRERFKREQRLMASLEHPNILPIYEAGVTDGGLFLAMRLVRGGTLADVIHGGGLDTARTARLIGQAAAALDAAHEAGLVHRDVKPQNMLVDGDHLYLSDFGLAAGTAEIAITVTGELMGSLNYIAPEQIQGEATTAAADIYSLGCVLFEALTGRLPFFRDTDAAVLYAHMTDSPPRPSELRPDLPRRFDDVVARALAKSPADRYRTAGELAVEVAATVTDAFGGSPLPPASNAASANGSVAAAPAPAAPLPIPHPVAPPPGPPALPTPEPTLLEDAPRTSTLNRARRSRTWRLKWPWRRDTGGFSDARGPASPAPAAAPAGAPDLDGSRTVIAGAGIHPPPPPRLRLKSGFRYVHEPLADNHDGIPLLGNAEIVAALKERIVHSSGGAFLITGFRGVGKTTIIVRALSELGGEAGSTAILPIRINVARPRTVEELLFEIIRRVFETLKDEGLLKRMAPHVQRELLLAYARTSLSFNETRSKAAERSRGISIGLPSLLEALAPKLEASRKLTDSLATQAAFLAYTDADVEHDFLRIVSLVERGDNGPPELRRAIRRRGATPHPPWQGRLVIVIDELDKLTADEDGMRCVSMLLSGLKNLLTARGVHFLFVAGPDLHDVALRESRRGNSVFESVFSWQFYVPCLWQATDRLLKAVLADRDRDPALVDALRDYLRFKSRGVPRLLLMELNSFVRWDDEGAYLEVRGAERGRLEFYADLERVVRTFVGESHSGQPLDLAIDQDRWKLGAYYVTDWILRSDGVPFTVDELVGAEERVALHPIFTPSRAKVRDFLNHLVEHGIVRLTPSRAADRTYQGDAPSSQQDVFQLAPEYRAKLADFARVNERERADLGVVGSRGEPWAESQIGRDIGNARYELLEELDREGRGRVYRARDRQTSRDCAVKVFEPLAPAQHDVARARLERAAHIARGLSHPNIVETIDSFEEDGRLVIVMALLPGTPLSTLLDHARLTTSEAVTIASRLAEALSYIHEQGIARLDLKPSSILVDDELTPVVLDLGLAKAIGEPAAEGLNLTMAGAVLATPAYAAPEQLRGEPADIRTDIYAIGLILYEMLAGRRARRGGFSEVLAVQEVDIDVERLDISDALRQVIVKALAPRPDDRFIQPSDMGRALAETPEAQAMTAAQASVLPADR